MRKSYIYGEQIPHNEARATKKTLLFPTQTGTENLGSCINLFIYLLLQSAYNYKLDSSAV